MRAQEHQAVPIEQPQQRASGNKRLLWPYNDQSLCISRFSVAAFQIELLPENVL